MGSADSSFDTWIDISVLQSLAERVKFAHRSDSGRLATEIEKRPVE